MLILLSPYNIKSFITSNCILLINFFIQMASLAMYLNAIYLTLVIEIETNFYFLLL